MGGRAQYYELPNGTLCLNSIDTNRDNIKESVYNFVNPEKSVATRVTILDGLWFCVKKEMFDSVCFDDHYYDGFHFYDLDLSMRIKHIRLRLAKYF